MPPVPPAAPDVRRATRAVYAVFILAGVAFASFAARIPQVRDALELSPRGLGLVLLSIACGSVISMPLAGVVEGRLGAARTVAATTCIAAVGLAGAGIGTQIGVAPVVAALFLMGLGMGTWDVAMNVEGAAVERALRRAIMPRFHAGFSIGTVAGALIGAALVALGVSVAAHLLVVAALVGVGGPSAVRGFLAGAPEDRADGDQPRPNPLLAWKEPRTLLVGLFVLSAAFTEGTGNDWIGVAMIDGYDAADAIATLTFAVFLAAMTVGRWFGPAFLDRHGRVQTVRILAAIALAGLVLVVFGGSLPIAVLGAALWGLGISLGFPVGMSAAGDDPRFAAARVSVVASIGYVAFLAGPPLIGFLGEEVGTLRALTATAGMVAIGLMVSASLRPLPQAEPAPSAELASAPGAP